MSVGNFFYSFRRDVLITAFVLSAVIIMPAAFSMEISSLSDVERIIRKTTNSLGIEDKKGISKNRMMATTLLGGLGLAGVKRLGGSWISESFRFVLDSGVSLYESLGDNPLSIIPVSIFVTAITALTLKKAIAEYSNFKKRRTRDSIEKFLSIISSVIAVLEKDIFFNDLMDTKPIAAYFFLEGESTIEDILKSYHSLYKQLKQAGNMLEACKAADEDYHEQHGELYGELQEMLKYLKTKLMSKTDHLLTIAKDIPRLVKA